mmetsp:Transcript_24029/g.74862  ORF Transcript_24029/g.74862 Transcript_24029/m.74862 type:complete len:417 (-) Transcript_24029:118-1368(-)
MLAALCGQHRACLAEEEVVEDVLYLRRHGYLARKGRLRKTLPRSLLGRRGAKEHLTHFLEAAARHLATAAAKPCFITLAPSSTSRQGRQPIAVAGPLWSLLGRAEAALLPARRGDKDLVLVKAHLGNRVVRLHCTHLGSVKSLAQRLVTSGDAARESDRPGIQRLALESFEVRLIASSATARFLFPCPCSTRSRVCASHMSAARCLLLALFRVLPLLLRRRWRRPRCLNRIVREEETRINVRGLGEALHAHLSEEPVAVHDAVLQVEVPHQQRHLAPCLLAREERRNSSQEALLDVAPLHARVIGHVHVHHHHVAEELHEQAAPLFIQQLVAERPAVCAHSKARAHVGGDAVEPLALPTLLARLAIVARPEGLPALGRGFGGRRVLDILGRALHLLEGEAVGVEAREVVAQVGMRE